MLVRRVVLVRGTAAIVNQLREVSPGGTKNVVIQPSPKDEKGRVKESKDPLGPRSVVEEGGLT